MSGNHRRPPCHRRLADLTPRTPAPWPSSNLPPPAPAPKRRNGAFGPLIAIAITVNIITAMLIHLLGPKCITQPRSRRSRKRQGLLIKVIVVGVWLSPEAGDAQRGAGGGAVKGAICPGPRTQRGPHGLACGWWNKGPPRGRCGFCLTGDRGGGGGCLCGGSRSGSQTTDAWLGLLVARSSRHWTVRDTLLRPFSSRMW